ncbi:MAG: 4Fe-4S dicluster domain-containing protein [Anaerolineae bacterium]
MTKQLGWYIDLRKCVGCHSCTVSCKAENNTPPGIAWRRVITQTDGLYPKVTAQFVSMACFHCEHPACLAACPVEGAIVKREEDGIVLIDQELCVGCRRCEWACPYGAPQLNPETKKVEKCTFCVHRIEAGLHPACVTTCIGDALHHGDMAQITGERQIEEFANPDLTNPSVRFRK